MIYAKKIRQKYFEAIVDGKKTFEVRRNTTDYKLGDDILLDEVDEAGANTGRSCFVRITYILPFTELAEIYPNKAFSSDLLILGVRLISAKNVEEK